MHLSFKKTAKTRILFFLLADIFLIILSVFLAFLLRFDGSIPAQYFENGTFLGTIVLVLAFSLPIFYFSHLYSFSWAYVSTNELVSLLKAIIISFSFTGATLLIFRDHLVFQGFPRSTLLVSYILIFLFCGGIRLSKRLYLQLFQKEAGKEKKRTLIVGAGDAGEQILRSILRTRNTLYLPVGFVDDNLAKQGIIIHGLKVLGKINHIPGVVKKYGVQELIVALPSAGPKAIKDAVEMGRKAELKEIKIIPSMGEIISGEASIRDLRKIQAEDLLGREPVLLDVKSIEDFISDKIVLVTGAAGSIGSELSRQVAKFKPSLLLLLDQDETGIFNISNELRSKFFQLKIKSLIADIRDEEKINQIFAESPPDIVFHAAAYKHVPLMERHPDEAIKNNIFGTRVVVKKALRYGTKKFIFISTDKAINPSSVMGATKRVGEMICQVLNQKNHTKFISVRFGNVLESRGSVIPIFKQQIKKGGPVQVTHPEMKRYLMVTSEAVLLVMQAGAIGKGGEVFVLDMGEPIKILDLAKELIRLSGLEPDKDIPIVFTKPRPGEKFFEEILTAEEGTIATQNQKIFMAKLSAVEEERLERGLSELTKAVKRSNRKEMITVLKKIVTSYKAYEAKPR